MNEQTMYQKVYGCWMGKNIGGTLGGPVEGKMELMNHTFYTQDFHGRPMENDDLDLQLLNLHAVEQYGIRLTSRQIATEWKSHVFFCMDEYALFLSNARRGVETPLSGHFNNEFIHCMGSPIRSEIWAVLAPGNPQLAAYFAYQDAAVDHAGGEGVYGEVFFAALESMAFVSSDLTEVTERALTFIPDTSVTARAIRDLMRYHTNGLDWITARQKLIDDYGTANFCYAPLNIAFTMLGLFYGKDFTEKMLITLNCGYDTDCTAATAGSILGILHGADAIPQKWIDPIGTAIVASPQVCGFRIPKDIAELTERSMRAQKIIAAEFENCIDPSVFTIDYDIKTTKFGVPSDSLIEQDLLISVSYQDDHPAIDRNETKKLFLKVENKMPMPYDGAIRLHSPDGLTTGEMACFTLQPGEEFCYETFVTGDGVFHPTYPLEIVLERHMGGLLWSTEVFHFALRPTYRWSVSKNGGEPKLLASPTHRLDLEALFGESKIGDVFTAEAVLELPTERNLRYMVHTMHPVVCELDGEIIINRPQNAEPYLPAFHRPCPSRPLLTAAGKHTVKITATVADRPESFALAFQTADLSELFVPNRGWLQEELLLAVEDGSVEN